MVVPPKEPQAILRQPLIALTADAAWREKLGASGRTLAHLEIIAIIRQFDTALLAVTSKN